MRVWTIRDLARRSNVHEVQIGSYERGESGAHPRTIRKLADALTTDPENLIKPD